MKADSPALNESFPSDEISEADKLRKELLADPYFIARITGDVEELKRIKQSLDEFNQAAAPIFEELSRAGFNLEQLSDLYRKKSYYNKTTYSKVIPILIRWLPKIMNLRVKSEMVSILSVKWAKPAAAPVLIEEFLRAPDHLAASLKWTIGDALSVVADDSVFDNLVIIVQNKQHGKAREMIATALGNMKNPRAIDVLIDLLQDEDVAGHALIALGRLKAGKARHYIEPFLNHSKSWIRKEANRALAKIDKAK